LSTSSSEVFSITSAIEMWSPYLSRGDAGGVPRK
jgi:hypothetical protein